LRVDTVDEVMTALRRFEDVDPEEVLETLPGKHRAKLAAALLELVDAGTVHPNTFSTIAMQLGQLGLRGNAADQLHRLATDPARPPLVRAIAATAAFRALKAPANAGSSAEFIEALLLAMLIDGDDLGAQMSLRTLRPLGAALAPPLFLAEAWRRATGHLPSVWTAFIGVHDQLNVLIRRLPELSNDVLRANMPATAVNPLDGCDPGAVRRAWVGPADGQGSAAWMFALEGPYRTTTLVSIAGSPLRGVRGAMLHVACDDAMVAHTLGTLSFIAHTVEVPVGPALHAAGQTFDHPHCDDDCEPAVRVISAIPGAYAPEPVRPGPPLDVPAALRRVAGAGLGDAWFISRQESAVAVEALGALGPERALHAVTQNPLPARMVHMATHEAHRHVWRGDHAAAADFAWLAADAARDPAGCVLLKVLLLQTHKQYAGR
jgi:hypothetical protein